MPDPSPPLFQWLRRRALSSVARRTAEAPSASPRPHKATLDGLRFLAFLAVFYFHARPDLCPWGWAGVRVFFTLSGFLITRILLQDESGSRAADLKRFYIRRTLRIFPLYYGLVAYFLLFGQLSYLGWFLTYLSNIKAYFAENFDAMLGHFWTLSVEEQFYLLFPPLLLATPRRGRFGLVVAMITGSVAFQVYAHASLRMPWAKLLSPYCVSDLAWGALAGMIELRRRPRRFEATALVVVGTCLLVVAWKLNERRFSFDAARQFDLAPTVYGFASACLIFGLWRTTNPLIVWPLSVAPVAYLGRISYGLYAFHLPVLRGVWPVEIPYAFYIPELYRSLIETVILASLSWRFFEAPINRLKDRSAPSHITPA